MLSNTERRLAEEGNETYCLTQKGNVTSPSERVRTGNLLSDIAWKRTLSSHIGRKGDLPSDI